MVVAMWSDVLAFLQAAWFVDILLPGSVDRTGPFPAWQPLTLAFGVYLQAESGLVQFTSVDSNGGLRIRPASQVEYGEDLRNDPEENLVAASGGASYFTAPGPWRCTAMRLFTNNESVPEDGIFRAAEMTFEDACTVFFDPFWTDGIRLGTGNAPDLWLAEHRSPRRQEIFGPLKETTRRPAQ
jgi:hypothetical protein